MLGDPKNLFHYIVADVRDMCPNITKNARGRLSNPVRYPRFSVSVSGTRQYIAFAFGVPHDINGFHPYTMSSMYLLRPLVVPFRPRFRG